MDDVPDDRRFSAGAPFRFALVVVVTAREKIRDALPIL